MTQKEIDFAISEAKKNKYYRLEEEKEQERKKKELIEVTRPWNAENMLLHAKIQANLLVQASGRKEYILDEFTDPIFKLLSLYFTNDPLFEKDGMLLSKGIMLIGDVGVGKTDLLKAFRKNKRLCFFPETVNEVERRCRVEGLNFWQVYTGYVPGRGHSKDVFYQPNIGWMFDDLGTEEVIKDYGNTLDVMERIIHERYMKKDIIPFHSLHITTNLNGELIEKRYGYRMRSRIREMFNIIQLKGNDRRK